MEGVDEGDDPRHVRSVTYDLVVKDFGPPFRLTNCSPVCPWTSSTPLRPQVSPQKWVRGRGPPVGSGGRDHLHLQQGVGPGDYERVSRGSWSNPGDGLRLGCGDH